MTGKRNVVLFDLDGTVLDTYGAILGSLRYSTEKVLGKALPDDVLVEKVGQPLITQMKSFTPDPLQQEAIMHAYRQHNEHGLNSKITPFPGMKEVLEQLREQGYVTGIVTSKRRAVAEPSLVHFGMREGLACLNGLEDSAAHKPKPDPLLQAAKDIGVSPNQCMYVGDSPYDLQAAHAADMPCIGVTWGKFFSREVLEPEHPTIMVTDPHQLIEAVNELSDY